MKSSKFEYRVVTALPDAHGPKFQTQMGKDGEWRNLGLPHHTAQAAKKFALENIASDDFIPQVVEV